jgi:hypothetical protein
MERLQVFLRHYQREFRPRIADEDAWFVGQPSLALAISFAGRARDWRGKRLPHSNRLRAQQLQKAEVALLAAQPSFANCRSFDELLSIVSSCLKTIWTNPELFSYDTALRIGAKLGLTPEKVYLHRGTRIGARALGMDARVDFLTMNQLPSFLQVLEPREVEDFLCIFKDKFEVSGPHDVPTLSPNGCLANPAHPGYRRPRC